MKKGVNEMTRILGINFSEKTQKETVEYIDTILNVPKARQTAHVITANPEIVMSVNKYKGYQKIVKNAEIVTPDGIGILIASKILGGNIKERVTGFDTIMSLFDKREEEGNVLKVYFLGSDKETIKKASREIEKMYHFVKVVGFHHGYFNRKEEYKILKEISEIKPDLLLVGLGAPKQDQFIFNNKKHIRTKVSIGVGGTFDVIGRKVLRAPEFLRNIGLEWLWRLLTNPKRIIRQTALLKFAFYVLLERLGILNK